MHFVYAVTMLGSMYSRHCSVSKNLKAGKYSGVPAIEISEHNKMQVYLKRFAKYFSQIKSLSQKVASLEASLGQKSTI